jgi:cobalt-precorrin 5A hydrolase
VTERKPYAIYAITKHGIGIAGRLLAALPDADLYVSEKLFAQAPAGARLMPLPMGPTLSATFTAYDCHIHLISVGAVVRMVAPLLQNKKVDPAIVCVDDAARFAICVLSGHVGRGNAFTDRVAQILDATSVVTTASDVGGTLTVDILGRELGWQLDDLDRNVTRGCAAVVNQAEVALVQETGEPDFWPLDKPLPPGVRYATSLEQIDAHRYEIVLIASDRELRETARAVWEKAVIYRPRSLVLGVGCDRNTPPELMERGVRALLAKHGLSPLCVHEVVSIDVKGDEPAILQLADTLGAGRRFFSAAELDAVAMPTPSEMVKKHVGTRGVAEPAALLASGAAELLVPKQVYTEDGAGRSMTLAVARRPFARRPS